MLNLTHVLILIVPKLEDPFVVVSDISWIRVGVVILQGGRPIDFGSREFSWLRGIIPLESYFRARLY
jgi:hypothetical protein